MPLNTLLWLLGMDCEEGVVWRGQGDWLGPSAVAQVRGYGLDWSCSDGGDEKWLIQNIVWRWS